MVVSSVPCEVNPVPNNCTTELFPAGTDRGETEENTGGVYMVRESGEELGKSTPFRDSETSNCNGRGEGEGERERVSESERERMT